MNKNLHTDVVMSTPSSNSKVEEWKESLGGYKYKGDVDPGRAYPFNSKSGTNETKVEENLLTSNPISSKLAVEEWEKDILSMSEAGWIKITVENMTGYIKGLLSQARQEGYYKGYVKGSKDVRR